MLLPRIAPGLVAAALGLAVLSTSSHAQAVARPVTGTDAGGGSSVRADDPAGDVAGQDEVTAEQLNALDLTGMAFKVSTSGKRLKLALTALGSDDPRQAFDTGVNVRVEFTSAGDRYRATYDDDENAFGDPLEVFRGGRWRDACSSCAGGLLVSEEKRRYDLKYQLSDVGDPRRITFNGIYTYLPGTDRGDDLPGSYRLDVR